MIGAALADAWKRAGAPRDAIYAELGPGRGTLASDAVRVLGAAGFSGEVHFVETSPVLRDAQALTIPGAEWHDVIEDLPNRPMLLVANEFLDALPIRQFVEGAERRIVVAAGGLAFDRDGEIVEDSPASEQAAKQIAERLVSHGGVAIVVDYGHERSAPGETLQAMCQHHFVPVLSNVGEQDLTAHVDFEAIARAATGAGAAVTRLVSQGEWLIRLGIEARGETLSHSNPERAEEIAAALHRLTSSDQMGNLFKVMAFHSPDWPSPAGFA
jgi:NADH dehydrogenase [ubiquinone] 1 alpha subcomplex assembly factor 7